MCIYWKSSKIWKRSSLYNMTFPTVLRTASMIVTLRLIFMLYFIYDIFYVYILYYIRYCVMICFDQTLPYIISGCVVAPMYNKRDDTICFINIQLFVCNQNSPQNDSKVLNAKISRLFCLLKNKPCFNLAFE